MASPDIGFLREESRKFEKEMRELDARIHESEVNLAYHEGFSDGLEYATKILKGVTEDGE